jgi:PmbA protein
VSTPLSIDDPDGLSAQLADIAEFCVAEAARLGASASDVGVTSSTGLSVTVRMGEVETIEHIRDKGLGVTVYFDHRKGSASSSDFGRAALTSTVEAACAIARHTGEDEYSGLADASRMASVFPDLDLYHPIDLGADDAIDLAIRADNAARAADVRIINSDGSSVGTHATVHAYANSHGFTGTSKGTRHSISTRVIAQDSAGMQRDYWYDTSRVFDAMDSPESIGARAAERAVSRLSSRRVATGTFPVIYSPEVAGGFFGHFIGAIRGGNLYRKASFLLDSKGEQIFPKGLRIHEQPHLPQASGSCAFDGEGIATAPRDIVTDGVVQDYVLNSYAARRLGLDSTANAGGVHNLTIDTGDAKQSELVERMGRGLLVTELMGSGVNSVTGDYSRGAAGYWVENGETAFPVHEITIAGNLKDMFMGIQDIGGDVDTRGNIRTGSILINAVTIAGD